MLSRDREYSEIQGRDSEPKIDDDFSNAIDVLRCLLHQKHHSIIIEIERLYCMKCGIRKNR